MDFVSDPAGGHLAARVEVSYDGRAAALWAAIEPGKDEAILSGEAYLPDDAQDIYSIMSILRIQRATGMPKSYESDTQVVVDGRAVDGKVIEVNRPLTYGGYQISQSSYGRDAAGRVYTVLEVRSNAGLYVVYAGFGLICLGAMWWCWLAPLAAHLRGRKAGDGA